jgi:hypothetical protein
MSPRKNDDTKAPAAESPKTSSTSAETTADTAAPALPPEPRPQEAFAQVVNRARALSKEQIKVFRADAELALYNVRTGLQALAPFFPTLPEHLPKISVAILLDARTLAAALVYADDQVGDRPRSPEEIEAKLERLRELRQVALDSAELLAKSKLLPADRVKKIRQGAGRHDAARDGVDLEELFHEFDAKVRGKHPLSAEELAELGALGHELVQVFPPPGAHKAPAAEAQKREEAAALRDRIWTLLQEAHLPVRKAGHYFFDDADEHVPTLQARRQAPRSAPAPQPAPAPRGQG